jgi:Predicted integral membrane protein (DUF2269)
MDQYLLLRFAHLVGLMLMSAGLIGVFVADMRSGALLLLASGTWLIVSSDGGWEFLKVPWLVGMVILFAFEFEGNTITRLYFVRLRRLARAALAEERVTPELADAVQNSLRRSPTSWTSRFCWLSSLSAHRGRVIGHSL